MRTRESEGRTLDKIGTGVRYQHIAGGGEERMENGRRRWGSEWPVGSNVRTRSSWKEKKETNTTKT